MPAGVGYGLENVAQFLMEYFREQRASERDALERAMREKERKEDVAYRTQQAKFQQTQFEDEQAERKRQTLFALQERVPNAAISPEQAAQAEALGMGGILNHLDPEPFTGPILPTTEGIEGERPILPRVDFFRPTAQQEAAVQTRADAQRIHEEDLEQAALDRLLRDRQVAAQERGVGVQEDQLGLSRETLESVDQLRQAQIRNYDFENRLTPLKEEARNLQQFLSTMASMNAVDLLKDPDLPAKLAAARDRLAVVLNALEKLSQQPIRNIDPRDPLASFDPREEFP